MKNTSTRTKQLGASLVELTVVLLVGGLMSTVVYKLASQSSRLTEDEKAAAALDAADSALIGYVQANLHFPPAESNMLPAALAVDTQGLPIYYFIAPALLTAPTKKYDPSSNYGLTSASDTNLLDLCYKLSNISDSDLLSLNFGSFSMPVAAVVEYPGIGTNAPASISDVIFPGQATFSTATASGPYARAMGVSELYGRLGCPKGVGRIASSTKYLASATDMLQLASANVDISKADIQAANANLDRVKFALAKMAAAIATATVETVETTFDILSQVPYIDPVGLSLTLTATSLDIAGAGLAVSRYTKSIESANAALSSMQTALEEANEKYSSAEKQIEDAKSEVVYYRKKGVDE